MARAVSIDLGSKRIGVAASDATRTLASPVVVVQRRPTHQQDHDEIAKILTEYEADTLVVGHPLSLDGSHGPAARLIESEFEELVARFGSQMVVVLHDERFTTTTAHKNLKELNLNEKKRRQIVDMVAAAVLLQSFLDTEKARGN